MARFLTVAAAQLGPVQRDHTRAEVVARLVTLLRDAHGRGAELVVFPELALTTFFPRWFVDDISEADHYYETSMPNADTQPLFDEARRLGVGFEAPKLAAKPAARCRRPPAPRRSRRA